MLLQLEINVALTHQFEPETSRARQGFLTCYVKHYYTPSFHIYTMTGDYDKSPRFIT